MSSEPRDLSKMPDTEFQRQLQAMQDENTRRLNAKMQQAQAEIDAILAKYPELISSQVNYPQYKLHCKEAQISTGRILCN